MDGPPLRVLTGGQTGVDRAALDAALAAGLAVGGWCPAGRWGEDGPIPNRYPLYETASADPAERTRRNVEDAGALLVLAPGPVSGGTARAVAHARGLGRPALVLDPRDSDAPGRIGAWLRTLPVPLALNVAGPRESEWPDAYAVARACLGAVWPPARPAAG